MISVLMPSRGRPELCAKARKSAFDTATGEIEILVYVDDDDPMKSQYKDCIYGPPKHSGNAMKHLAGMAKGDILFFGCDDFEWKTKGWDKIFKERMPEHGLSVLFPRDRNGDANKSISPAFTKRWMEVTGLFPDCFEHFGPDTWIVDIARRAGTLVCVPDVLISHTKVKDDTFHRSRRGSDAAFASTILSSREEERKQIADKVRGLIK